MRMSEVVRGDGLPFPGARRDLRSLGRGVGLVVRPVDGPLRPGGKGDSALEGKRGGARLRAHGSPQADLFSGKAAGAAERIFAVRA